MKIFISGTGTDVGKTLISSWIVLHTGFSYFKPIQTGTKDSTDSEKVQILSGAKVYPEIYSYPEPLSPHLAAKIENDRIEINKIVLPKQDTLLVEGAGGVLVPLNEQYLMVDLIKHLNIPVILVSLTNLGCINHTLLSLEALRARNILVLGVIMNGRKNVENNKAIEYYGRVCILDDFPYLFKISTVVLKNLELSEKLKEILNA
ncbi:ATP-dependent dethiobiotin synthetase BioD [Holospora elegans E1]|uniref:ATP-dependent dethiobiotin synthetase BioD n=1 Tax=Holospora elegans E1 TaxID=1427503 RepID=A0A023DXM8_9PROT|nr:dethiobiotin synthase [Holospora elegans]GAJ46186.1 ATP-dependent dethiobiotin synthetase BioD [Holospora elegans E1]